MRLYLDGRVALVTGAGSGIGRAIALTLAAEGAVVCCGDLNASAAEATVGCAGSDVRMTAITMDVGDPLSVKAALSQVEATYGRLDILVNSAGLLKTGSTMETGEADWRELERVNLAGVLNCACAVIPRMASHRWGRIINVASVAAFRGGGSLGNTLYGATKAAVVALTMGLARELGPAGITVNAIAPAVTLTPMTEPHIASGTRASILQRIPLGRFATPEDSAALVAFLASDCAAFITGTAIPVDGGLLTT
ncbi:MAG: glucose 1-dehydrogenase [Rhodospirillales bacterium]|nr:glucose 1-dehydrogenase [Rhodospirillales bacterium]